MNWGSCTCVSLEMTGSLSTNCSSVKCFTLKADSQLIRIGGTCPRQGLILARLYCPVQHNKLVNGWAHSPRKRCGHKEGEWTKFRVPHLSPVIAIKSIRSISNGLFPSDGPCLIRVRAGGSLHARLQPLILPFPLVCLFFYCLYSAKLAFVSLSDWALFNTKAVKRDETDDSWATA